MSAADPRTPPPSAVLQRIIGHGVDRPGRPAAEDPGRQLDYAALCTEVGEVAAGLVARQVGLGDRVGVHLPNSVDFVVAALAAMWVGAAFVPLAVTDPDARLDVIVADCDPAIIVTSSPGGDAPILAGPRAAALDDLRLPGEATEPVGPDPDRPVYAVYTSGTTGTPKGVVVTSRAFAAAITATIEALDLDGATRTLCVSAFHFDGSFATLFPTLAAGGSVVILPRVSLLFARTFFTAVSRYAITYTGFSPSYLRLLLDSGRAARLADTPLRVVALGGEAASRRDVEELRALAPEIRIFNRYGPTETVIAVTHHEIRPAPAETPVPIGRAHPGVDFYLVDDDGHIVEGADLVGELWIGGIQLMVGYRGAPDLTAAVLRRDVVPGKLVYRSGDVVARSANGEYRYIDRADRVVKRSGVRISLVELTGVLRSLPGVLAAATTLYEEGGPDTGASGVGGFGIVSFVVAPGGVTGQDLRRAARLELPATMVPDRIEVVDGIPLTPAGKVDEGRLLVAAGLRPRRTSVVGP